MLFMVKLFILPIWFLKELSNFPTVLQYFAKILHNFINYLEESIKTDSLRREILHATTGDHNHCLNFLQGSEFVPLTQLRIELYRSTRTGLINQCWRQNILIYPKGCILISTHLRRSGLPLFWYQYIPVIAWLGWGLYFPFKLQSVQFLYHQAPWWSTAQLLIALLSASLSLVEKGAPTLYENASMHKPASLGTKQNKKTKKKKKNSE